MANSIVLTNTLETILTEAGFTSQHAIIVAADLIRQVQKCPADTALIGIISRRVPIEMMRQILAAMPMATAALCYARLIAFGLTAAEIKNLIPQVPA